MTRDRAREVERICTLALEREPTTRAAFLDAACAGDEALRLDVASLLAREAEAEDFLLVPALELAAKDIAADGQRLVVGRQIGAYQVLSLLGSGGMGEVYRARDTLLMRDVAIKILAPVFSQDRDRLARFEREAHVLASLNHPHIAAIYGLADDDGVRALVLELVDGPTLAERLAQGPLPVTEALVVARQIAEALEAAHEKGIVHRDLKPANIKITDEGIVKVLDFGLAKSLATIDPGDVPSPASGDAGQTAVLGTPGYMSPEQFRGKPADKRSDIWAFGCVLYEMLTGRAAMAGEMSADVKAATLERAPDWDALPAQTPAGARRLLRRCLEKDPKRRLHDIADARIELDDIGSTAAARRSTPVKVLRTSLVSGAILSLVAAGFVLARVTKPPAPLLRVLRFSILPPENGTFSGTTSDVLAISPDGGTLAFVVASPGKRDQLWLRSMDTLTARAVPGTDSAESPFWAPDSQSVGFFAHGMLKAVKTAGGEPWTICEANGPRQATWNQTDEILFSADSRGVGGLRRVSAAGGMVASVTTPDRTIGETGHLLPVFLPDGRHFLYDATAADGGSIYMGSLDSRDRVRLLGPPDIHGASSLALAPGYVLYVRDGTLWAQPFDAARLERSGEARRVADDIQNKSSGNGAAAFSVSTNGTLAYWTVATESRSRLAWFTRDGRETPTRVPLSHYGRLSLAPDERRVAIEQSDMAGAPGLVLLDLVRGTSTRLTSDAFSIYPIWSPDGASIAFSSTRDGAMAPYRQAVTAGEDARRLFSLPSPTTPTDWSADGRTILYQTGNYPKGDIGVFPVAAGNSPRPLLHSAAGRADGHLSPDRHWLAYMSTESWPSQVYVTSFPDERGRWPISTSGGREPRWRRDGKELYFLSLDGKLMAAAVRTRPAFHASAPTALFDVAVGNYAVAKDGRFLLVLPTVPATSPPITVVLNWTAALAKK